MGGHRTRIPDRICFQGIRIRPVTGCLWVSAETPPGGAVSDTTLRARRDEWTDAGVFDAVVSEALAAYDRIVGLDLSAVSGRRQSAQGAMRWARNRQRTPVTGPEPGWKWSLATDANGIPGWVGPPGGADRHDSITVRIHPWSCPLVGHYHLSCSVFPTQDSGSARYLPDDGSVGSLECTDLCPMMARPQ